jgi:hypothetical protein
LKAEAEVKTEVDVGTQPHVLISPLRYPKSLRAAV